MRFRVMPLPPHIVLQATYRKIKRIANRGFQISAGGVLSWFAVNHNFLARSGDVNSHLVQVAVPMMSMWLIDDHPATHYAPAEFIEPGGIFANRIFNSCRVRNVVKADLQRQLHDDLQSKDDDFQTRPPFHHLR